MKTTLFLTLLLSNSSMAASLNDVAASINNVRNQIAISANIPTDALTCGQIQSAIVQKNLQTGLMIAGLEATKQVIEQLQAKLSAEERAQVVAKYNETAKAAKTELQKNEILNGAFVQTCVSHKLLSGCRKQAKKEILAEIQAGYNIFAENINKEQTQEQQDAAVSARLTAATAKAKAFADRCVIADRVFAEAQK